MSFFGGVADAFAEGNPNTIGDNPQEMEDQIDAEIAKMEEGEFDITNAGDG